METVRGLHETAIRLTIPVAQEHIASTAMLGDIESIVIAMFSSGRHACATSAKKMLVLHVGGAQLRYFFGFADCASCRPDGAIGQRH
jgi:hypothetical protein